jgi:hypothetical protein
MSQQALAAAAGPGNSQHLILFDAYVQITDNL